MKRWQVNVWRFTIAGKSRRGNWYEGCFRWFWMAYFVARTMALLCDFVTPKYIFVDGVYESPHGIKWAIRDLKEVARLQ